MFANSLFRLVLSCTFVVFLASCGGGGGGGGDTIIAPPPPVDENPSSGTITLSISGLVDEDGNADNILSANEVGTISAEVIADGEPADLVVTFTTDLGTLLETSAQTVNGIATVEISGNGTAGAAMVTASATLTGGETLEATLIVQMSADAPEPELEDESGQPVEAIQLAAQQSSTITVTMRDWDGTPLRNTRVNLTSDSLTLDITTGVTDDNGQITVTLTGQDNAAEGTFTVTATTDAGDFAQSFTAISTGSSGGGTSNNRISVDITGLMDTEGNPDNVLSLNEVATLSATVIEDNVAAQDIVVAFTTSGGKLQGGTSATTNADGVATIQIAGAGDIGAVEVTAAATLTNGIQVESPTLLVQSSASGAFGQFMRSGAVIDSLSLGPNEEAEL